MVDIQDIQDTLDVPHILAIDVILLTDQKEGTTKCHI